MSGFTRWPRWRRWFGSRAERVAAKYLASQGLRILARNWSDRRGEIDLIALAKDCVVVVEVRSSEGHDFRTLSLSVDHQKQRRLTESALRYLQSRKALGVNLRFDVVLISWPVGQRTPHIVHHTNAFEAVGRYQWFC